MLLVLDIGNTNITFAWFKGNRMFKKGKIATKEKVYLKKLSFIPFSKIEAVIISSVVPASLKRLKKELQAKFSRKPLVLGENIRVPIVNLYRKPAQVGQDRLAGAYAGYRLYGGGLAIVDFGTAVTFDVMSFKGEYLGGMIFPGLRTSFDALCQKAALLPKHMRLEKPKEFIGRTTEESIRSGIYNGFAGLFLGIIAMLKRNYSNRLKVMITGGDAREIYPLVKDICIFKPDLTLLGLKMIYEKTLNSPKNNKII